MPDWGKEKHSGEQFYQQLLVLSEIKILPVETSDSFSSLVYVHLCDQSAILAKKKRKKVGSKERIYFSVCNASVLAFCNILAGVDRKQSKHTGHLHLWHYVDFKNDNTSNTVIIKNA